MEFFKRAKVFRLKCGHQSKYLMADKDEETVRQSRNASSQTAHWAIELVEGKTNVVRFRSCQTFKYLATTDETFLTGMTGKKLAQRLRLDSTVEWEPVKEGPYIKLKSRSGTLLRANPGIPPWRNTVTHDVPGHWTSTENMVLWIVDIVELDYNSNGGTKDDNESPTSTFKVNSTPPEVVKHAVDVPSSSNMKKSNSNPVLEDEFGRTNSDGLSRLPSAESMSGLAVNVAKLTVKELKNIEFHTVLSSGQIMKLDRALSVISANVNISARGNHDLANLKDKLKILEKDHKKATQELVDCTTFSKRRYEKRAELKKDAAKARELEAIGAELSYRLVAAKDRRRELLRQLEETEDSIKGAEKGQTDSKAEIEEIISCIKQKTEAFKVMERENKSLQARKYEAQRMLEKVEEDWLRVKDLIAGFL
ncbi:hypothetical protein RND81_13G134700 [Saponaria officinalis]|uniref:DUF569 domain-containing protein n=1 Tax=Saponaria officinalis TaxID=3572 RepID=A0AAW1H0B7_SAPOF